MLTHSEKKAKRDIKSKVKEYTFKYLTDKQKEHIKVKHIVYRDLETQEYLRSAVVTNKEAEIITALRSQTVRGIKNNIHTHYKDNLQCQLCEQSIDSQEHCMKCPTILSKFGKIKDHIKYEHVYGNIQEQKEVAQLFLQIL